MARRDDDEPTLGDAWTMLGEQLGLSVEQRGERSIRATGTVRGRAVTVDIEGEGRSGRKEFGRFLAGLNTISSRNQREKWHTTLTVGCNNPTGVTGTIESSVDLNDPAWKPGEYDPRRGRSVTTTPPDLADRVLTADTHERLMSITEDLQIEVEPTALVIVDDNTTRPGSGANYVAGSFLHHYQGAPPPWPERAIVGPPWWITLVCDLADTLDG
jgi:hypothetical protein